MKQIDYYRLKNVFSIRVYDKYEAYGYFYRDTYKDKYWWFSKPTYRYDGFIKNEGYDEDYWVWHSKESIEEQTGHDDQKLFLVIGNVVYNRPKTIVTFSTGTDYTHLFDTIENATEWAEDLLKKANLNEEVLRIN